MIFEVFFHINGFRNFDCVYVKKSLTVSLQLYYKAVHIIQKGLGDPDFEF